MVQRFNDVLAQALAGHGVEVMFGVMGDANMYVVDSFHRNEEGRFVPAANEGGAVLMAAGYAAVTGRVGVATVTHGAIANCVSALFDATRGHYPLVVVAGDTVRSEAFHLQNIPQRDVVVPTGAAYLQVRSVDTVTADLAAAMGQALAERRPVVLEVPADFQQAPTELAAPRRSRRAAGVLTPTLEDLEDAVGAIAGSNRPLVVGGRGAGAPGAADVLRELAVRIGAPVATTLRGKGLFAGDPCDVGIVGTLSHPVASEVIARADCLIVFGAALSALTTLKGELLDGKRLIQVDTDPGAPGRYFPVDVAIAGDASATARGLIELLDQAEVPAVGFRSDDLARRIAAWHEEDRATTPTDGPLTLTGVLHRVNEIVPRRRTLAIDGGRFSHEALRILDVDHPWDYAHCLNVGHIGMGVGYGIGAAVGRPEVPALVVVGDGGFMLGGLAEFNTAVRNDLDLLVVLLNDGAYGAEYYRFVGQDLDPSLTTFDWPDFTAVASSLGGTGLKIEEWSDFDRLAELVRPGSGPVLAEVVLDVATIPDPGWH
ncbi:thiamine pyrophosphate-binding protein [Blastococcus goldschmidtiae]|uniref:Thiamine pyrophosphate-binding protein n=1 Tax=Blastococcus goldschmidtiae TaxID=3075546 RepID=A0ABU2K858_9ACTN|nr:thiamine pyrophosphate-binding protein [Blastococcus sp. DSM 46792]MDT0276361.1 thiamine pyrophosphate-binding protein [Blastococcus sp. DSM 46792]